MNRKIIFFDIDGTLINEKKEVASSTVLALKELKQAGHQIFICTGRTKCMLPKVITDLEFDGYVYGGGTALEYEGKLLQLIELSYDQVLQLIKLMKQHNVTYVFEGYEHVFVEKEIFQDERTYYRSFILSLGKICAEIESYDKVKASKATCVLPAGMTEDEERAFMKAVEKDYQCVLHERVDNGIMTDGLVEILPKGWTKGKAIQMMAEKLGFDIEDTVGVGDSNNDLEMLEVVGTSICMGNGSTQAKALADFVTKGVNEDGILHAMRTLEYI